MTRYIPEHTNLDDLIEHDPNGLIEILEKWGGTKVDPLEFLHDLYPIDWVPEYQPEVFKQNRQCPGSVTGIGINDYSGTPMVTFIHSYPDGKRKGSTQILSRDFKTVSKEHIKSQRFLSDVYISECGYLGRQKIRKRITCIYGLAVDLDYQTADSLNAFLEPASDHWWYPIPTYITLSGTGVHLWYLFEQPIELYHGQKMGQLSKKYADACKKAIIERIWNPYTVQGKDAKGNELGRKPQIQSIAQSYRMPGTMTKQGYLCTVWRIGNAKKYFDFGDIMSSINNPIPVEKDLDRLHNEVLRDIGYESESGHDLEYWKKQNPVWYQRRVVEGKRKKKGHYILNRRVYDWFVEQVPSKAAYGHRYWCMWSAVIIGRKCGLSKKEIEDDLRRLMPELTKINPAAPMEEADLNDAMAVYSSIGCYYVKFEVLENKSGIKFHHMKRNGRDQKKHLAIARATTKLRVEQFGESKELLGGRPDKQQIVKDWRADHPEGTKAACIRETNLDKKTVYKWWN